MSNVYYIPSGPKNLQALFPTFDFTQVASYNVQLLDTGLAPIITSPLMILERPCEDDVRIHFKNYLGGIDSLTMGLVSVDHETKSGTSQSGLKSPLVKNVHGLNRINVYANETYNLEKAVDELDLGWLTELTDTTKAWLEWNGSQGQTADYLPIVVLDAKMPKRKRDDRYQYVLEVSFILSNDVIICR